MRKLHYHRVDVFTNRAFGGNPLAVFTDGRGLSTELMQSIAKEFNLSETTFVLPSDDAACDYRVRIFTPEYELPMAGHPTVGTSFVLARERMLGETRDEAIVTLEEGVGRVPVRVNFENGAPVFAEMSQPPPAFGPRFENAKAAQLLSLDESAVAETGLPPEIVSCGVPFLFVPVTDLEAARRARLRIDVWERDFQDSGALGVFLFTREVVHEGSTVHSRMYAPGAGITEDPATGGASGPLGCYLVQHGVVECDPEAHLVSEQGLEMGRPSFVKIRIVREGERISGVKVGGECFYMGAGFLELLI